MANHINLKSILEFHPLFGVLPTATLNTLSSRLSIKTFAKDQYVFMQGDSVDYAYLILTGEGLLETLSSEGRNLSLGRLGVGDLFGEFSLLDGGVRSTGVITVCNMRAALISKKDFTALISGHPEFSMKIIKHLVRLLRQTDARLESEHFLNLYQKLAYFIVKEYLKNPNENFHLHLTQAAIARELSASREKINNALKTLKDKGHVVVSRGKVQILNLEGLKSEYISILGLN